MRLSLPSGTPVELAIPEVPPTRGVVLVPDVMGLRPLFDDLCRRLAAEYRWALAAVEPFPGREHLSIHQRFEVMAGVMDEDRLGDLTAAADLLSSRSEVDRVAVLGFCIGAMYTLKAAGTGRFDRAVAFYGMIRVPAEWRGPGQGEPLDWLATPSNTPVLAIVGGQDAYTPADDVAVLQDLGERVEVVNYPDAEHGFAHDPARPTHRPDDTADAWTRVANFLV